MLIATDGACKRLGKPNCTSTGVAWIQTNDGDMLFKAKFEENSTSQRGEINGLILALKHAVNAGLAYDENLIIVTDSEYVLNTVSLEWCFKWRANNWTTGSGDTAKNADLWDVVCNLLDTLGSDRVFMQWTKGHLINYTVGNTNSCMNVDHTGTELYARVNTLAHRPSEYSRIAAEFNAQQSKHDRHVVPEEQAVAWAVANVVADRLADYVEAMFDASYLLMKQ